MPYQPKNVLYGIRVPLRLDFFFFYMIRSVLLPRRRWKIFSLISYMFSSSRRSISSRSSSSSSSNMSRLIDWYRLPLMPKTIRCIASCDRASRTCRCFSARSNIERAEYYATAVSTQYRSFRDQSFQAIGCAGFDNQTRQNLQRARLKPKASHIGPLCAYHCAQHCGTGTEYSVKQFDSIYSQIVVDC